MNPQGRLLINVQDHQLHSLETADVEIKTSPKQRWKKVRFDKTCQRFLSPALEPESMCTVRVRGRGYAEEERRFRVTPGDRSIFFNVAPPETPYYSAAEQEKVYFRSDERKMLMFVSGEEARDRAPDILREMGADSVKPIDWEGLEHRRDEALFEFDLGRTVSARKQLAEAIWEQMANLPQTGLQARLAVPMYRGTGVVEGLTNELAVRFVSSMTLEQVKREADRFGFDIVRTIPWAGNGWLWRRRGVPTYEMLDFIRELEARDDVVWAEPNVLFQIASDLYSPNDFLYPEQPHYGVIGADDAWDTLDDIAVDLRSGSPDITVAIFDVDGVTPNHPDLTGTLTDGSTKMTANWNFASMSAQTVGGLTGGHGTKCASSAVGRFDNSTGVSGLAGNCHLIGARLPTVASGVDMAEAWIWSAGFTTGSPDPSFPTPPSPGADVISNSWGVTYGILTNAIRDGIDFVTTFGRSGKGCVMCFSVGNLGYSQFSTMRRYAAYEKTLAIGASINANPTSPVDSLHPDPSGSTTGLTATVDTRAFYSPYGPELDLVAPSHTSYTAAGKTDQIVAAVPVDQGHWTGEAATLTTTSAALAVGDTSISVASAAGFTAGEIALLEMPGGANREFVSIVSVVGNQINTSPLLNAHPFGTQVSTGPNDYDRSFGGTSHSCPTVAGAAALVLSARPELTWVEVRELLRDAAEEIDFGQTNAVGQWVDLDGDGIREFSQWYGFGRLDVDRAVSDAQDLHRADVVIRDNLTDVGTVPSAGWHAHSPDIWVRRSDDPIPVLAYGAAPPHEPPQRGHDNFVYLRVKNIGPVTTNEFYLRALICHFPGFEFRYPDEWMPTIRPGDPLPSPLLPGTYLIGEERVDGLAPGSTTIVKMRWDAAAIPPETVMVGGVPVHWHPCILAEVSPHDGPAPAGATGFPVRHDNNLAHRNITIEAADFESDDAFAIGMVAGTTDPVGIDSIILDRTELPADYRVFVRAIHQEHFGRWMEMMEAGELEACEPLPSTREKPEPKRIRKTRELEKKPLEKRLPTGGYKLTMLEEARMSIDFGDEGRLILTAPAGTRLEHIGPMLARREIPRFSSEQFHGQTVLVFEGGAQAVELPLRLAGGEFMPMVIGLMRPAGKRRLGFLKASQRRSDGEISSGYTIEG